MRFAGALLIIHLGRLATPAGHNEDPIAPLPARRKGDGLAIGAPRRSRAVRPILRADDLLGAHGQVARDDTFVAPEGDLLALRRPLRLVSIANPLGLQPLQRQPPDARLPRWWRRQHRRSCSTRPRRVHHVPDWIWGWRRQRRLPQPPSVRRNIGRRRRRRSSATHDRLDNQTESTDSSSPTVDRRRRGHRGNPPQRQCRPAAGRGRRRRFPAA